MYLNSGHLKHTLLILILIHILNCSSIYAQSNNFNFEIIKGKILDDSTGLYIPSVNIYNESTRNWDYSTNEGTFTIWVDMGDTLVFSAVGYLSEVIIITNSLLKDSLNLKLEPRTYEIGEVTVKSVKKYSQFKQDVINLKLPRTELDSISEELANTATHVSLEADHEREVKEVFDREKGTLFMLEKPIKTKNEKQLIKLNKTVKYEERQKVIDLKYNREIVKKYTKLSDEGLTKFMIFCNFNSEFLLNANDYEIADSIIKKHIEYQQIKF